MAQRADLRNNLMVCASFGTIAFLSTIAGAIVVREPSSTLQWACLFLAPSLSAIIAIRAYSDKIIAYPETIASDLANGFDSGAYSYGMQAFYVHIFMFSIDNIDIHQMSRLTCVVNYYITSILACIIAIRAYYTNPQLRGGTAHHAAHTESDNEADNDARALIQLPATVLGGPRVFLNSFYLGLLFFTSAFLIHYVSWLGGPGVNGDLPRTILLIVCIICNLFSMYWYY